MTTLAFSLIIFSALLHALWNFALKKAAGSFAVYWYGVLGVNLLLLGGAVFALGSGGINEENIMFLLLSVAVNAAYCFLLSYSYSREDISTVYPIARGTGVLGTVILSHFILREHIRLSGLLGAGAIVLGVLCISFGKAAPARPADFRKLLSPALLAVLTGTCTACYSVIDKLAMREINPVLYIALVNVCCLLPLTFTANRDGFRRTFALVREHRAAPLIVGLGTTAAYLIILYAMKAENASYIVPVREMSVVFAALMGFVFLKEKPRPLVLAGIVLVTAGLVLIKAAA